MEIETLVSGFHKARATNYSTNGYPSKVPTATAPAGDGVVSMVGGDGRAGKSANGLMICPYAIGADNVTFSMRVIGWRKLGTGNTALWIPVTLCEIACTASAAVGVTGQDVLATERFADTLVATKGNNGVSIDMMSTADDTIAHVSVDAKGSQFVELAFTTGGSATSCNALWSKY